MRHHTDTTNHTRDVFHRAGLAALDEAGRLAFARMPVVTDAELTLPVDNDAHGVTLAPRPHTSRDA